MSAKGSSKRKRSETSDATTKKKQKSLTNGEADAPEEVAKSAETPTFASTAEWLESEQWNQVEVGDETDLTETLQDKEIWLVKMPVNLDPAAFASKTFSITQFTELKPGQPSQLTLTADGKRYVVQASEPGEYRQAMDLLPSSEEHRIVLGRPFQRGFSVTETVEAEDVHTVPVRPRPIVPQPSNLRLRFRPPGYVMTTKESKEEELRGKKHSKAVQVAKHAVPPLRPVPDVTNTAGVIRAASLDESQMDEDEEEEKDEDEEKEDETPLVKKKKKAPQTPTKSAAATTTTPTKKKEKKKEKKQKGEDTTKSPSSKKQKKDGESTPSKKQSKKKSGETTPSKKTSKKASKGL